VTEACEHCHYEPESRHRFWLFIALAGLAILVYTLSEDVTDLQKKVAALQLAPPRAVRAPRPIPGDEEDA
jgi:hypothetical protein